MARLSTVVNESWKVVALTSCMTTLATKATKGLINVILCDEKKSKPPK